MPIGITGILTEKYGVAMAEGFFHGFSGWVFFMVSFACLLGVGFVLAYLPPKGKWWSKRGIAGGKMEEKAPHTAGANINRAFYTSIGLMVTLEP